MSDLHEGPGHSRSKRKMSNSDVDETERKLVAEETSADAIDSSEKETSGDLETTDVESVTRLGEYLSSEYEVLLRVLSNLPAVDLRRAAQVCRSWRSAARVVRDARLRLHWLFWCANRRGWNIPPPLAVYSAIYEHVYSQPTLCITFFSKTTIKSFECSAPDVTCPKTGLNKPCGGVHTMESFMGAALSSQCNILSCPVSGIIGSSHDLKSTFEVEHVEARVQAMSAALFPNHPNVKAVSFELFKKDLMQMRQIDSPSVVEDMIHLPKDMLVQAVMLFCGYRVRECYKSGFLSALQARQEHKFAVGGGVTEATDSVKGVIFVGNDVCALSAVIPESVTEKDQVQEYANKIKACNVPTECSMVFMFSCLGRGKIWYDGDSAVESGIFNKTFPKTPVIGFFGQGEVGINSLFSYSVQDTSAFWRDWNLRCKESEKSLSQPPKKISRSLEMPIHHTYSTCIMLLSFNIASSTLPL